MNFETPEKSNELHRIAETQLQILEALTQIRYLLLALSKKGDPANEGKE